MQNLGQFNITKYLSPAQPLSISSGVNFEYIRIINNSPYLLTLSILGVGNKVMPEFYLEDIYLPSNYLGSITITPQVNITSVSHNVSTLVTVDVYMKGEISYPQSQPLAQPAVISTASGKPIFTATWEVRSTASVLQNLAIFNPANSGVSFEFHSAKVLTNDSTLPTCNLIYWNSNPNLANSVNIVTHTGWNVNTNAGLVTSLATASADDASNNFFQANRVTDIGDIPANLPVELLAFPDIVLLNSGVALIIELSSGTTGHTIRLTLKWTELVQVLPIVVTGPNAVASSLQNDGNPSGVSFIESSVTAVPGHAFNLFNDGSGVWQTLFLNNLHQVLKTNTSTGNPLQLGQAGDIVEVLGQLTVDQAVTFLTTLLVTGLLTLSNSIKFKTTGQIDAGFQMIGDTTIAHAGTSVSHSLGVVPKVILPVLDEGAAGSADVIGINYGTASSSSFTAYTTNSVSTGNVRFFVMA